MAKQHFYSRVPSRVAMYYKANGFDTFATSEGVTQEFVETNLSSILDQKPTAVELTQIRNNELAPIYAHFLANDGSLVESCVSFLDSDYSGERSSFVVHSIILNEKERKEIHYHKHSKAINDSLFLHDLSSFNIDNYDAKPIKDYPTVDINRMNLENPISDYLLQFDPTTTKRFIFALIYAIMGKYKAVHVVLPNNKNSEHSLEFFNNILQILPYHLRKSVSFVSRVSDYNKYPGFKLKIITDDMTTAPTSKGVTINFKLNECFGIKESDFSALENIPDFLYYLIGKKEERYEMFEFFQYAEENQAEFKELDMKSFVDLMFLFKASSGLYEEDKVLPNDDSMMTFINAYEKERDALCNDFRMNIMKSFRRYPDKYLLMPKQLFNKMIKLYPSEPVGTKHIFMNMCLDLIHTDLMRKELFSFIKSCYDKEEDETKEQIINHLCSVFNGEFLQEQILEFFEKNFEFIGEKVRKNVLDTLFLAIRTVSIQNNLFMFMNSKYEVFTFEEKKMLYDAAAFHLPEGDKLAKELLNLCDEHIVLEDDKLKEAYSKSLCKLLLDEQRAKLELLLSVVAESNGFTFEVITRAIFTKWRRRKFSGDFIVMACRGSLLDRVKKISKMWIISQDDIEDELSKKFIKFVKDGFDTYPCVVEIDEIYESIEAFNNEFSNVDIDKCADFKAEFKNDIIDVLILNTLVNVFKSKNKDAVEKLIEYTKTNELILNSENYHVLSDYLSLKEGIKSGNALDVLKTLVAFVSNPEFSKKVGAYLVTDILSDINLKSETDVLSNEYAMLLVSINYLKTGKLKISNAYDKISEQISHLYEDNENEKFKVQTGECIALKNLLDIASRTYASEYKDKFINEIESMDTGISVSTNEIFVKYGKAQLQNILNSVLPKVQEINNMVISRTKGIKSNAKLFAKVVKL